MSAESTQIAKRKYEWAMKHEKPNNLKTEKKKNVFQWCLVIKQLSKIDFMCFNMMCTWPGGVENKCFVVVIYAFI